MTLATLLILAFGAWRISRFLIEDHLFEGMRNRIWKRFPPESTRIGYLFTCYWCLGFWVSLVIAVGYILFGGWMTLAVLPFALSAVVGLIDARLNR